MSKKPKSAAPESAPVAEVLRPDMTPKVAASHAISPLMCFLAAAGAGAMTLTMLGYTAALSVWALAELMGLPHWAFYGLLALAAIPVLWTALWVAGRAWHVEQLISRDQDVDTPVFSLGRYWGRR